MKGIFEQLEEESTSFNPSQIIKAPFPYPGAKTRSLKQIIPLLPYRDSYIEPFGGTGAVLLARNPSPLEVLNDRYMGINAFYRCIRDKENRN